MRARATFNCRGRPLLRSFTRGTVIQRFYVVSLLRPEVVVDLQLGEYGYEAITLENALYIDSSGDHLLLTADEQFNQAQFEKFSQTDFQAYQSFEHSVDQIGQLLAKQWLNEPPKLGEQGIGDLLAMLKMGVDVFRLDAEARWRLMQFLSARRKR